MSGIHDASELHRIDLNLLVALDALTREGSVTKAAHKVGVTQSAMSHTLRRLRELFGDPLLVRGRGGMVLTSRAEALLVPLRGGLTSLARALGEPAAFSPATAQRRFRIVAPDLFEALVLPAAVRRIVIEAPGVELVVAPFPASLVEALESGEVDVAIVPILRRAGQAEAPADADAGLRQRTLLHDRMGCFVRRGHPLVSGKKRPTLAAYLREAHLLVSPTGEGPGVVDHALAAKGLRRRIALRVPQFASALALVRGSDLVLTAPRSLSACAETAAFEEFAPPLALPRHAINMQWHHRFSADPAHRWLRELLEHGTTARPLA